MIQPNSRLLVADNTGAKIVSCITVLGSKKFAQIGDQIVASVKVATPTSQVKKKSVVRVVIVRQKKNYKRKDGSYIRFDDNAAVIIGKGKDPKGSRIIGPIAKELRDKGYKKIASQAIELI